MARLFLMLVCLCLVLPAESAPSSAPQSNELQTNELSDPDMQRRYQALTRELRCPMCQNESIAESGAPIANDMRRDVHQRLEAGQSNDEIVAALVARFGEFVRYRPALNSTTALLWFGPFVAVALGLLVVLVLGLGARRRQRGAGGEAPGSAAEDNLLDATEQARLARLLQENERNH